MNMTNKVRPASPEDPLGPRVLDPLGLFSETDEQLALGLADQAAVNLHKARLYDAAVTDRLTGLKNTRHFEECLLAAITEAKETGTPLTLAVTDLDHFKQVNDTYGHAAGDELLIGFASCLGACFHRDTDLVARLGGDEFFLLAAATPEHEARRLAEEVRLMFEASPVQTGSETIFGTCSFGVAMLDQDPALSGLLERADQALYESKAARHAVRES